MNRMVGVWWSGNDDDARPAGHEAKGYSSLSLNAVGSDFPVMQDILKYVVDTGSTVRFRRKRSGREEQQAARGKVRVSASLNDRSAVAHEPQQLPAPKKLNADRPGPSVSA